MTRSLRLVTAALTASAALLLTACGSGGGDSDASDKIEGADGGGAKASASASPGSKPDGSDRPEIKLPGSFRMDFVTWTNSDPKLQAILDDGKEQLRGDHAAIIDGDADAAYVKFYNSGASLQGSRKWIKQYVDDDLTLVGKMRISDPKVEINDSGEGVLFYCVDEGKAFTKNRKTGEKRGTPPGDDPRLLYRTMLHKSADGVWQTTRSQTERGGC
ncbi:hypothetical protein [Streptomyces alfalfae]|uniref:hypothetical protein n=1 Tax=Streptomyces alfalfae TaxID=1642299 RepID=UPI0028112C6C|nr:hypothetical protein [Streptomyces alfalfae]